MPDHSIHIIGGGLAGCEAAWQAAQAGAPVILHEMRPIMRTDAHQTDRLAELVCSNSFRSDDWEYNAVGLLHAEMRRLGSLIMSCADRRQTHDEPQDSEQDRLEFADAFQDQRVAVAADARRGKCPATFRAAGCHRQLG